jgi:hypothetical protein
MDMGPIKNLKGVQRVTGCLAALSRFIARLRGRNLPLYKLMNKSDHFTWTPEVQEALDSLKNMLMSPPILTAPTPKELMLLYIPATTQVVSATLVVEREEPKGLRKCNDPCTSSTRYSPTPRCATPTLLRCTPHHGGVQVPAWGGHSEPRGRREDHQVGARADGIEHHLRTTQCYQVTSTRGLRGQVDGDSNSLGVG